MKKITKILCFMLCFCLTIMGALFAIPRIVQKSFAEGNYIGGVLTESYVTDQLENFLEFGKEGERERLYRIPGSKAEYNSAMYIKTCLESLSTFEPVQDASTKSGVQRFDFTSIYDGKNYSSQNIIFRKESLTGDGKKVVIGAHYDTSEYVRFAENVEGKVGEKIDDSEGVNDNAGGVALLLSLAKLIDEQVVDFGFDLEVVFFGASTNNFAGSNFYNRGLGDEDASKILCYINLDKVTIGRYNYFYVNEYDNSQKSYVGSVLTNKFHFKSLKTTNLLHFNKKSPNGLEYTHIGLDSDHAVFMQRNINVVNLFSGDYENLMTFGLSEYNSGFNLTYTQYDNYEYIRDNYGDYKTNLSNILMGVCNLLLNDNFVAEMQKNNGAKNFYNIFTNKKLAVFIAVILFLFMTLGFYLIYCYLQKRAQKAMNEHQLDKIVIKITKNLGQEEDDLSDFIDEKVRSDTSKEDNDDKKA